LAYRLFAAGAHADAPLELAAGRLLTGLGTDRLPVILVSLVGLTNGIATNGSSGQVVEAVIDEVAELQLLGAGFRPVFLLDMPAFSRARSYGYLVEVVTPQSAWSAESVDWSDYVAARVASMRSVYGISAMITVGPDGLDDAARGVLRSFGLENNSAVVNPGTFPPQFEHNLRLLPTRQEPHLEETGQIHRPPGS
jgi:hypothetical protein